MCDFNMHEWCERLIEQEGIVLYPYYGFNAKLFIGVKHCLDDYPLSVEEKRALGDYMHGITINGAKMILRGDILRCYELLKRQVKFYENLDEERKYVLLDLCFQLGIKGVRKNRAMIKAMSKNNFDMAAFELLLSDYARENPKRAKKLAQAIKNGYWKRNF